MEIHCKPPYPLTPISKRTDFEKPRGSKIRLLRDNIPERKKEGSFLKARAEKKLAAASLGREVQKPLAIGNDSPVSSDSRGNTIFETRGLVKLGNSGDFPERKQKELSVLCSRVTFPRQYPFGCFAAKRNFPRPDFRRGMASLVVWLRQEQPYVTRRTAFERETCGGYSPQASVTE